MQNVPWSHTSTEHSSVLCVVVFTHLPYTLLTCRFVVRKSSSVIATRKQARNAHGRVLQVSPGHARITAESCTSRECLCSSTGRLVYHAAARAGADHVERTACWQPSNSCSRCLVQLLMLSPCIILTFGGCSVILSPFFRPQP